MKFKMVIIMVTMIVLLAGCGVKPENNTNNQGIELGETPPQPIIKADGKAIMVYQSSYCWNSKSKGTCADYASPNEMLKDKSKEHVKANVKITYEFDVKKPTEITVSRFHDGTLTQETLNGDSFQTPQENGIYYYSLSAVWLKDKEKRISEGSSNYVFVIEVV
jgi:hypothetical protein